MESARTPAAGTARAQLTERDLELLAFIAEHRIVLAYQVRRFLGASSSVAYARLRALSAAGLVRQRKALYGHPSCYQATSQGIGAAGRSYRAQEIDYGRLQHDLGLASLWLAARAGTFGPFQSLISERAMRSSDASAANALGKASTAGAPAGADQYGYDDSRQGVRLGGVGERGRERLHYPDLLLVTPQGKRIALELELTSKGAARREKILMGYAFDRKIDAVVYLVRDLPIGRKIRDSARRLGISDLVHVQLIKGLPRPMGPSRQPSRSAVRRPQEQAR